ncbi:MAG: sulfite exporter TauE/SafE family protein [Bacteroidia bacterium]
MESSLWMSFSLGLMGSLHCVGMCGPIVLTMNLSNKKYTFSHHAAYHVGKLITYMLLGMMMGLLGEGIFALGWQQPFSVIIGVFMLLSLVFPVFIRKYFPANSLYSRIKSFFPMARLLTEGTISARFLLGFVNGFLPCGLLYSALALSATANTSLGGGIQMLAFGVATIPALWAVGWFGQKITPSLRQKFTNLVPYTLGIMAIFLILRGSNLGIPYLSPEMNLHNGKVMYGNCCHK